MNDADQKLVVTTGLTPPGLIAVATTVAKSVTSKSVSEGLLL